MFYHLLFFVPSVLLSRQVNKIDFVGIKKTWRTYLLSIPRNEALAIAYQS